MRENCLQPYSHSCLSPASAAEYSVGADTSGLTSALEQPSWAGELLLGLPESPHAERVKPKKGINRLTLLPALYPKRSLKN